MYIDVKEQGVVVVHASHRLTARLHGISDWRPAAVQELLIDTALVPVSLRGRLCRFVDEIQPAAIDIEAWQCVVACVFAQDDEADVVVSAWLRRHQRQRQRQYTLENEIVEEKQHVYVCVCTTQ